MKRLLLSLCTTSFLLSQTPTPRPSVLAMSGFLPKQIKLSGLTSSGFSYIPPTGSKAGGDVYFGQQNASSAAGKLVVGSIANGSTPQVSIQDQAGFVIASTWGASTSAPLVANNTYSLDVPLSGAWFQGGYKITCTDSTSGVDCAKINIQLYWLE